MNEVFTRVEIVFYPEFINHWLRFGVPDAQHALDRRRSVALFGPGKIIGYIRWHANDFGTQAWSVTIVRTCGSSETLTRLRGIKPGGEVLLVATGTVRVKRVLSHIDVLAAAGFNPCEISPAYYRHLHNRITVGRLVRAYSMAQHAAHLAARAVSL